MKSSSDIKILSDQGVTLISGEEMNAKHGRTFQIPSKEERANVKQGAFVKAIFKFRDGYNMVPGERMWCRVIESLSNGEYLVELDNKPFNTTGALSIGDRFHLKDEHVVDIYDYKNKGEDYNGWTNRSTWNVNLWMDNDRGYYRAWTEMSKVLVEKHKHTRWTPESAESFVRTMWRGNKTPDGDSLDPVNWEEIAEHWNDFVLGHDWGKNQ